MILVPVRENTDSAEARRTAENLARNLGFDETETGNVALVVREVATNLIKHGGGGTVVLRALEEEGQPGLETLAIDRGRGIADVAGCFRDGYSTAGGSGTGLGVVARLSELCDLYSAPGSGTVLISRIWKRSREAARLSSQLFETGAVSIAKPGEQACGDAWIVQRRPRGFRAIIADGLGHGLGAHDAARAAVEVAAAQPDFSLLELIDQVHAALRNTRGAAIGIADLDLDRSTVSFGGVGNIGASVCSPGRHRRQMISHDGTAGHVIRRRQQFDYSWNQEDLLVMHSDGLGTHWNLDHYPGLAQRHPSVIAGVLYRDFDRARDDTTVLVLRQSRRPA